MNAAVMFVLFIVTGQDDHSLQMISPKIKFENLEQCEATRLNVFKDKPQLLGNSFCAGMTVYPPSVEASEQGQKETESPVQVTPVVPKAKCIRPPSDGFASGHPCVKA